MKYVSRYHSPLGMLTMESDGEHLTGLWIEGQKYYAAALKGECKEKNIAIFEQTKRWLDIYFHGDIPDFTPPLLLEGSPFRQKVWEILREIPYGQVMTYGEIAGRIAAQMGVEKMSAQAVGGAVGHNPVSIIVPCHRVVGSGGSLTGYAGGIDKKVALLTIEKVDMKQYFIPEKGNAR